MPTGAALPALTDTIPEKESSSKSGIFVTGLPQLFSALWLVTVMSQLAGAGEPNGAGKDSGEIFIK